MTRSEAALASLTSADLDRFWQKVDKRDDCWVWTGCRLPRGYGKFGVRGVVVTAHRLALTVKLGRPLRAQAIHSCDNCSCVNPDHLREGTQRENVRDAMERGRATTPPTGAGVANPFVRLTEDEVRDIRRRVAAGKRQVDLAKAYGVTRQCVNEIVRGRTWTHVAPA